MYVNDVIDKQQYNHMMAEAFTQSVGLIDKEIGNLPQVAKAVQVLGAAQLSMDEEEGASDVNASAEESEESSPPQAANNGKKK